MSYYFSKPVPYSFDQAIEKVTALLAEQGFGILTEIDVQATFKKKLDVDFYKYRILGACNPNFAYQALQKEDKIGTMLPCNVIVQQKAEDDPVEVTAVDPVASMASVQNSELGHVAKEVQGRLQLVIENFSAVDLFLIAVCDSAMHADIGYKRRPGGNEPKIHQRIPGGPVNQCFKSKQLKGRRFNRAYGFNLGCLYVNGRPL